MFGEQGLEVVLDDGGQFVEAGDFEVRAGVCKFFGAGDSQPDSCREAGGFGTQDVAGKAIPDHAGMGRRAPDRGKGYAKNFG